MSLAAIHRATSGFAIINLSEHGGEIICNDSNFRKGGIYNTRCQKEVLTGMEQIESLSDSLNMQRVTGKGNIHLGGTNVVERKLRKGETKNINLNGWVAMSTTVNLSYVSGQLEASGPGSIWFDTVSAKRG